MLPYEEGIQFSSVQSLSSIQLFATPWITACQGLPVHHQLLEFTQTHVHRASDAIQPSHPLSSPSPPAPNLSQHQGRRGKIVFRIKPYTCQKCSKYLFAKKSCIFHNMNKGMKWSRKVFLGNCVLLTYSHLKIYFLNEGKQLASVPPENSLRQTSLP